MSTLADKYAFTIKRLSRPDATPLERSALSAINDLLERVRVAEQDTARLRWVAEGGGFDAVQGVPLDRYDFAAQAADENFRDEPNDADDFEGFRRLIDAGMAIPDPAATL